MSSPCHIELILAERGQAVKAEAVRPAAALCCGPPLRCLLLLRCVLLLSLLLCVPGARGGTSH